MTRHWQVLRVLALGTGVSSFVVLLTFGMGYDRYEMLMLTAGTALFAGVSTFFATFVFGPLSYPRASSEAILSWALLVFSGSGLSVVGTAAVRKMIA